MTAGLRIRHRSGTFIPRTLLRDPRLSLKAKGLLANLLDRPPGWDVRSEVLATEGPDGKDAIQAGLRELAAAGYYRLERRQGPDGRFNMGTAISDEPVPEWVKDSEEYGGRAVPVVWRGAAWWVRHKDGALTADGFEGYDDDNLKPGDDASGYDPELDLEIGGNTTSLQVTPEQGFPVPGNPAPEEPAPGGPVPENTGTGKPRAIRRTDVRVTDQGFRDASTPSTHHGGDSASNERGTGTTGRRRKPRREPVERTAAEQAMFDLATEIAGPWWESFGRNNVSIVGKNVTFPALRDSIVLQALQAGAQPDHIKQALKTCRVPLPSINSFQRALADAQTGTNPGPEYGRGGTPRNVLRSEITDEERGRRAQPFTDVTYRGQVIS